MADQPPAAEWQLNDVMLARLETRDWRLEVSEGRYYSIQQRRLLRRSTFFLTCPLPMPWPTHLPSAVAATVATLFALFASSSTSADAGCLCLSAPTQMRPVKKNNSNNRVAKGSKSRLAGSRLGRHRREASPLVIVTGALKLRSSHRGPRSSHHLLVSSACRHLSSSHVK